MTRPMIPSSRGGLAMEIRNYRPGDEPAQAEVARLPRRPVPDGQRIAPWERRDVARLLELGAGLFDGDDPDRLGTFFWENPHLPPDALFALRRGDATLGLGLAIVATTFADP